MQRSIGHMKNQLQPLFGSSFSPMHSAFGSVMFPLIILTIFNAVMKFLRLKNSDNIVCSHEVQLFISDVKKLLYGH